MKQTAEIIRVPTRPSCWRLLIWDHREVTATRVTHVMADEIMLEHKPEVLSTIKDVFETSLHSYHVLRRMAQQRGFYAPTFAYVQKVVEQALGPPDHDDGPTVGKQIVRLWNALDDHREHTMQLTITLSEIASDGSARKILLTRLDDYTTRQIG